EPGRGVRSDVSQTVGLWRGDGGPDRFDRLLPVLRALVRAAGGGRLCSRRLLRSGPSGSGTDVSARHGPSSRQLRAGRPAGVAADLRAAGELLPVVGEARASSRSHSITF